MTTDPDRDREAEAELNEGSPAPWVTVAHIAGLSSLGAGAIHAAAAGIHAETPTLSRLFVAVAAAQIAVGLLTLLRGGRLTALATAAVNAGAFAAWLVTRNWGISWIDGLEQAEAPTFADTACAVLGAVAAVAAVVALATHRTRPTPMRLGTPQIGIGVISVVAMMAGATHVHSHDDVAGDGHDHGTEEVTASGADATTDGEEVAHDHADGGTETETTDAAAAHDHSVTETQEVTQEVVAGHDHTEATDVSAVWPRPWDPTAPIDFSGVPGVTPEQQARAEALAANTLQQLPQFADVSTLADLGYQSIGDADTGFEHYINRSYIGDDSFLDPSRPESLVYRAEGDARTLVSAMFIARDTPIDDPELIDYGGALMQWHVHDNLCWSLDDDGKPVVVAVTDDAGNCPEGSINAGGDNPMVHVWIAPHDCGPFAALEGHGAGQVATDGSRTDQCGHDHAATTTDTPTAEAVPYDPTKPIDLSGVAGVTPEQQAFAENLIAVTLVDLPQWSDPAVAEAAGFHSIGDAGTGHEHYIQWDWINDDVWLDPDAPESLVFEPQADGSKKLVSAMYMLPDTMTLDQVPDYGGGLMQWHVHDNLCYTDDPVAPQVRGLVREDGTCKAPLVKHNEAPMIHVWITPNKCGPFAALEGVGAGAIKEGEERLCDHAHGS